MSQAEQSLRALIETEKFKGLEFIRFGYSRKRNKYILILNANKRIDPNRRKILTGYITRELPELSGRFDVVIKQPSYSILKDDASFSEAFFEEMRAEEPL